MYEKKNGFGCLKIIMYLAIIVVVLFAVLFSVMYYNWGPPSNPRTPPPPPPPVGQSVNEVINNLRTYRREARDYVEKYRNAKTPIPLELNMFVTFHRDFNRHYGLDYSFLITDNAAWVGRSIRRNWDPRTEVREMLASQRNVQLYGSSSLDLPPPSTEQKYHYRATDDVVWMLVEDDPKYLPPPASSEDLRYAPRYVLEALKAVSSAAQQYLRVNSQDAKILLSRDSDNLPCLTEYFTSQDIRWDLVTFRVSKSKMLWAGHNLISADMHYRRFFSVNAEKTSLYGSLGIESPPDFSRQENIYKETDNVIWIRIPSNNAAGFVMDAPKFLELCHNGSPEEVEYAIQNGTDINERYSEHTLLYTARRNPDVVSVLLRFGVDVNAKDEHGSTVLTSILRERRASSKNYPTILMLLEVGAEVDSTFSLPNLDPAYTTPEVVHALISRGLDVNTLSDSVIYVTERRGSTLLINAVKNRDNDMMLIIPVLLDMGADANIRDKYGKRAIDYAKQNKSLMENTEIYQRLKAATSDDIL